MAYRKCYNVTKTNYQLTCYVTVSTILLFSISMICFALMVIQIHQIIELIPQHHLWKKCKRNKLTNYFGFKTFAFSRSSEAFTYIIYSLT